MASATYRFGEFRLDPARRELWRGDEEVALSHSAFKCIAYLIENRDRAIGHDELIDAVWETSHLSDGVVAQAILTARHALGDSGKKQRFIKTVRGFGYRWGVPVETVEAPVGTMDVSPDSSAGVSRSPAWLRIALATLGIGTLLGGAIYLWRDGHADAPDLTASQPGEGSIALLLPVVVEAEESHAWVRLGLMDLIATRLRRTGQVMVPSDTVVALLRGSSSEPGTDEVRRLAETTGAHLVLAAQARINGSRWTVSLHSLLGAQPPLTAVGEAHDVLEAGHIAADQMARTLGLAAVTEPNAAPALQALLQRIEAARLAQQFDVARTLIEEAGPRLREHPDIRFQRARIEYYGGNLESAHAALDSLLEEPVTERDPTLRARVLNGLGVVYNRRGDPEAAGPLLTEAARTFQRENLLDQLGSAEANMGISALMLEDFDAARFHFSQARRVFEGVGNVQRLAALDVAVGALEAWRERYTASLRYFERAAERYAATHDVGGELRALANMLEVELELLNLQAASALDRRVKELLTQTHNAELSAHAKLSRIRVFVAQGRSREAENVLSDVLSVSKTEVVGDDSLHKHKMDALLLRAEREKANEADYARVIDLAAEVVEGLSNYAHKSEARARAWLLKIRAHLALGQRTAAAEAWTEMDRWAQHDNARAPRIYAALAEAELATVEGRTEDARAAFESALTLADTGDVPLRLLQVARSYVPWLLSEGLHGHPEPERAQLVAGRLAGYADQHYNAALLQLRVYHALGPPSAWRTALARAQSLAGERQIPPELLLAPLRPTADL